MANNPPSSGAQLRPPAPPQNFGPPVSGQFRPMVPAQQGQPFLPMSSQQFPGQNMGSSNVGMPTGPNQPMHPNQPMQFSQPMQHSQPMQQLQPRPGLPMSSQAMPMSYGQPNRPMTSGAPPNHPAPPFGNHTSGVGGMGIPFSSSYTFQQVSHMPGPPPPVSGQPWLSSGSQNSAHYAPAPQTADQSSVSSATGPAVNPPDSSQQSSSDWQEHATPDGRRYYYNKKTKQSSWEKPLELMSPLERADASTVWKEFTTPEGRKYYYNKITKESKWTIPEELKLAREQAEKAASQGVQSDVGMSSQSTAAGSVTPEEAPLAAAVLASSNGSLSASGISSTPPSLASAINPPVVNAASSAPMLGHSAGPASVPAAHSPALSGPAVSASISGDGSVPAAINTSSASMSNSDRFPTQEMSTSMDGASVQDLEEARKGMAAAGKVNVSELEEKTTDDEPLVFATKQEAKNAFKSLLESANVQSDWTWDQAMRVIVNDKRYGALKTLGERKQAFNEYLGQRKKQEAEERRMRQKKAKEEFTIMLEESKELTSSIKWSKAITMFEDDERFKAVEKPKDRQELFENYLVELQKKEKEKAEEEYRQNREEYWKFLESCNFIEANSLWRKVQDRLEDDERCSRLQKIDRLEIFQDYIRYLEKEEEEQKKIQKEHLRRAERKNRDEFRRMMEADVAAGALTAKTSWREYCAKVKESSPYLAVARNTSGSTPKDLFEDVVDELENQYHDDKSRIKDAMKLCKITMSSTWTFEEFKASISSDIESPPISDINLKLVFEEQLERVKEKEEKEAKKRQRLVDDFTDLLRSLKEISASSTWEDSRSLFEDSEEYREIGEDLARETFEDYVVHLQEKAKEKERKREEEKARKEKEREEREKRKEKERKEKDRDREKRKERSKKDESDDETMDATDSHANKDDNKKEKEKEKEKERKHRKRHHDTADDVSSDRDDDRERRHRRRHHDGADDVSSDRDDDRDRRHRKRHHDVGDDVSSDRDDKEEHKKSRRHGSDRKKSRKHEHSPESDGESRHKKHKRDSRDGRRNGTHDELEDGELGEDGEIQ